MFGLDFVSSLIVNLIIKKCYEFCPTYISNHHFFCFLFCFFGFGSFEYDLENELLFSPLPVHDELWSFWVKLVAWMDIKINMISDSWMDHGSDIFYARTSCKPNIFYFLIL